MIHDDTYCWMINFMNITHGPATLSPTYARSCKTRLEGEAAHISSSIARTSSKIVDICDTTYLHCSSSEASLRSDRVSNDP